VNRFCRSKFSGGSTSSKYPTGTGGEARVGVSTASNWFSVFQAPRTMNWRYAWAKIRSAALVALPRSRR
jgi:hypothetical protein